MAQPRVKKVLNKLGILKIVIERNPIDLEILMSLLSTEIHTFVVSWGEFSSSLEDVTILTSLSLFSKAYATEQTLSGEDQKRVEFLCNPCQAPSIRPIGKLICHESSSSMKERGGTTSSRSRLS